MSATNTKSLVDRLANDDLKENYALKVFPPILLLIMMSADELNPVKLFCVYTGMETQHCFWVLIVTLIVMSFLERMAVAYYATRAFLQAIQTVFFNSVDVIGLQNVPLEGPVIFVGNHCNQFADGIMLVMNARRKVGFLIAQKSWDLPIIGWMARTLGCVPLSRAADLVREGTGELTVHEDAVLGRGGTRFLDEIKPGDTLLWHDHGAATGVPEQKRRVLAVLSQAELRLHPASPSPSPSGRRQLREGAAAAAAAITAAQPLTEAELTRLRRAARGASARPFRVATRPDHSAMFSEVLRRLERGACIGIFPEGGSHDRTDLLPLKCGVADIALQYACATDGRAVPIVPCGLTYFNGHQFRARAVLEFGAPFSVSDEQVAQHYLLSCQAQHYLPRLYLLRRSLLWQVAQYQAQLASAAASGKAPSREAAASFMGEVGQRLRSVLVTAPDYEALQLIYMARRLYTADRRPEERLSADQKSDLNRRFAEGAKRLLLENESPPAELVELQAELISYYARLQALGVSDHQVPQLQFWAWRYLLGSLLMMFLPFLVAVVPGMLLNAPVGLLAHVLSMRHQAAALRASSVKLAARDVVLSRKILVSIIGVPSLWIAYGVLLLRYSGWLRISVLLVVLAFPAASYMGVRATEAGMVAFNDLRPLLLRLVRSRRTRQEMNALPAQRIKLQKLLRHIVTKFGPAMGDMYYAPRFDPMGPDAEPWGASDPNLEAAGARKMQRQRSASAVDLRITRKKDR